MLLPFRPLSQRYFAIVWGAALISNIGTWMQIIGVGVLVTTRTREAGWAAVVAAAAMLPMALLAPVGGMLADRFSRRAVLLATTTGELLMAAAIALLAGAHDASPPAVALLVLGGSIAAALGMPAFQAMLPDLVTREDLAAAISLNSAQFNVGRVLGPAAAGAVIAAGGYVWAFGVNAASFGAVLVALLIIRLPHRAEGPHHDGLWRSMATGARAALSEPGCRSAILLISATGLAISPFIALIPAVAVIALHSGSAGTSALTSAQGLGAVAGAVAVPLLIRRFSRKRVIVGAALAASAAAAGYALAPSLVVAVAILALLGAAYIMLVAALTTVVQARAPEQLRGRIVGMFMMTFTAAFAVGSIAQGAVADRAGLRVVTIAMAAVFCVALAVLAWRQPGDIEALADPAGDEASNGGEPVPASSATSMGDGA